MQKHLPDSPKAMTILWMWVGLVLLTFAAVLTRALVETASSPAEGGRRSCIRNACSAG